jgi:hypothetical protein
MEVDYERMTGKKLALNDPQSLCMLASALAFLAK